MKRWLLLVTILAIIIPIALVGLIGSETGSRWLLQSIFSAVPGQVSVEKIDGRLIDHLALTGLHYKNDTETVTVGNIDLSWQPSQLFSGTLRIVDLTINGLDISVTKTKDEEKEPTNLEAGIKLPLQLDIGSFLVTDVEFTSDGQLHSLDKLQLSAKTEDHQFKILSLAVNSDILVATAKGNVSLEKGFPLNLRTDWRINADKNGVWQGTTTVSGDVYKLIFDNHLTSPFKLALQGHVEDVLKTPRIKAQGEWHNLTYPFAASPRQIESKQGRFELAGLLNDYQLQINGQLNQQYLPQASLSFDGKGGLDAMTVNKLELKSSTGLFQLAGDVSWGDVPMFDLSATGQIFNPAIVIPELPGSLTFSSHLKGKLDPKALQITAEIDQLNGQLRKQVLNVKGKLALNGQQLKVDAFRITSGANKIAVDGLLGQSSGILEFSIDMPTLSTIWPTLGGNLKGNGRLQGGWKNPAIKVEAKGKRLQFAEHRTENVSLNIDYYPDDKKSSTLNFSASGIKSGTAQITQLLIEGKGSTKQHGFNADILSPHGNVSSVLKGSLTSNSWKGELSRLGITPHSGKSWSLKNNMPVRVEKNCLDLMYSLTKVV